MEGTFSGPRRISRAALSNRSPGLSKLDDTATLECLAMIVSIKAESIASHLTLFTDLVYKTDAVRALYSLNASNMPIRDVRN